MLDVSRERFKVGDIAQMDLDRLELQRAQFESDVETAAVNLRTGKIQLRALLNDRTPVDQLDVAGAFEYAEVRKPLEEFRQVAFDNRPDLLAAVQSVTQANTNYTLAVANGSTDPTIGWDSGREAPDIPAFVGININIPLRIFDRNQGEKARTKLDITRNERLVDAAKLQVVNDVDSAYATLQSCFDIAAALQNQVSGASGPRAGVGYDRVPARRRIPARFSTSPARLPRHSTQLPESGGFFSERRRSA